MKNTLSIINENKSDLELDRLVAVSDGVLQGLPVEGVRYNSPEHMTGWWLTDEKFDGNIENIKTVHLRHVLEARPELFKFLSLPHGTRFYQEGFKGLKEDVWIDEKIINE